MSFEPLKTRKRMLGYYGLYVFSYASLCIYFTYINLYLASLHYSTAVIGTITAIGSIFAIFGQLLWAHLSDRSGLRTEVLIFLFISSAAVSLAFLKWDQLYGILLLNSLFLFFSSPLYPLINAVILPGTIQDDVKFSSVTLSGTLSYALTAFLSGYFLKDRLSGMFVLNSIFLIGCILFLTRGKKKIKKASNRRAVSIKWITKNRTLRFVYLFCFFTSLYYGVHTAFFGVLLQEHGISTGLIGLMISVGCLSEIPVCLTIDRLISRFGINMIMLFSGFVTVIRAILVFTSASFGVLCFTQLLQGITSPAILYCSSCLIHRETSEETRSTGQTVFFLIRSGIATLISTLFGGVLAESFGIHTLFLLAGLCVLICTIYYTIQYKRDIIRQKRNVL